jgi:hypothetical protein
MMNVLNIRLPLWTQLDLTTGTISYDVYYNQAEKQICDIDLLLMLWESIERF